MDKREVKIEKLRLQLEQDRMIAKQLEGMLKNPLIEYILGILFIAYITRGDQSVLEKLTGFDPMAGSMGMGLTGVIVAQQLAPALQAVPELLESVPSLGKLLK